SEAVLALELAGDRGLEFRNAVDRGVLRRLAAFDRLDRGALDVLRRVEIRLPCPQSDHVTAGGFERTRLIRHRDGGGRLDALERVFGQGHENPRVGSGILKTGAPADATPKPPTPPPVGGASPHAAPPPRPSRCEGSPQASHSPP